MNTDLLHESVVSGDLDTDLEMGMELLHRSMVYLEMVMELLHGFMVYLEI